MDMFYLQNGTFTDVSRPEDDLRKTLGRYYDFFYNKDASNDPIISVPYYDGFGLGEQPRALTS